QCYVHGEVIHLKNGRSIWAERTRQNGSHVEYDIGDDSYAIPKSSVERIEAGGVAPERNSNGSKDIADIPSLAASTVLKNESELMDRIIRDGVVDKDALAEIDRK